MLPREPETKAQQLSGVIFNGTAAITTCCQDLMAIASAMSDLGLPAGADALNAVSEIREHARTVAGAFGAYTYAQAHGTLYLAPEAANSAAQ